MSDQNRSAKTKPVWDHDSGLEVDDENYEKDVTLDFQQMMKDLPPEVKRRVKALKKIQLSLTEMETKFYEELFALDLKYLPLHQQIFEKRRQIITGEREPNDEECEFMDGTEELAKQMNQLKIKKYDVILIHIYKFQQLKEVEGDVAEKVNGIPGFWLTVLTNVELLSDLAKEDVPILQHLFDITEDMMNEPMRFRLNFHFTPNEFFSNGVLTKTYEMKCGLDPENPFDFQGPEIVKCKGCTIDWNLGKNVTKLTMVKEKRSRNQREAIRTFKMIRIPSFFSFFSPPQVDDINSEDVDEETRKQLINDFKVGLCIRDRIIPFAVLYFTGEGFDLEEALMMMK